MNDPSADHYGPDVVPGLTGAHRDARDWRAFLAARGWESTCWTGADATTGHLFGWVEEVAARADVDLVVITWSGHGAQVPVQVLGSAPGHAPETDDYDELWVLHDRLLVDDEVYALVARFKPPARVVIVADSCHSGTSFRLEPTPEDLDVAVGLITPRRLDTELAEAVVTGHSALYRGVLDKLPTVVPTVEFVGLAACRDSERAYESDGRGGFTRAVLTLLAGGFTGSYLDLVQAAARSTPYQHPRPFWYDGTTLLREPAFN